MKLHVVAILCGSLLAAARACEQPLLPERVFQAVILPSEATEGSRSLANAGLSHFWNPSMVDVARAEARIRDYVGADPAKESPSGFERAVVADLRDHPERFVRQYFGATRAGERVIVCNALPLTMPKEFLQPWREKYIRVFDYAGSWELHYSPAKDRVIWFFVDQGY